MHFEKIGLRWLEAVIHADLEIAGSFSVKAESCLGSGLHGHFLNMNILQICISFSLFSNAFEGTK